MAEEQGAQQVWRSTLSSPKGASTIYFCLLDIILTEFATIKRLSEDTGFLRVDPQAKAWGYGMNIRSPT